MTTFRFQYLPNNLLSFLTIIILFTIIMASYASNGEMASETKKTNEQYLIIGKIKERKLIWGTNCAPTVGRTNENGTMTRRVSIPKMFEKIDLIDYKTKTYRIENRLAGKMFFSTNVPVSNIVVIVIHMADTKPDLKPCIVLAGPYSLPDDVIQNNNLQGATILQVEGIFKEGSEYDSILKKYGIKPPDWGETQDATNLIKQAPAQDIGKQKTNGVMRIRPATIKQ